MSHDRGCFKCGRDNWDYRGCSLKDCVKRSRKKTDVEVEREACAAQADEFAKQIDDPLAFAIGQAIRNRGKK